MSQSTLTLMAEPPPGLASKWNQFKRRFAKAKGKAERLAWDNSLQWYRLRYNDPEGPSSAINNLSRTKTVGRVVVYRTVGPIAAIYVGLPPSAAQIWGEMARDFGFRLEDESPPTHELRPLKPVVALPDMSGIVHVVDGYLFADSFDGSSTEYFPGTPQNPELQNVSPGIALPGPSFGISSAFTGSIHPAKHLVDDSEVGRWPLGHYNGKLLSTPSNVNVYGAGPFVVSWMAGTVLHQLTTGVNRVIVLDGSGDLAIQLKRKPAVAKQLQAGKLTYVEMGGLSERGFDPLRPLVEENADQTIERWRKWFSDVGAVSNSLNLLPLAYQDGVRSINQLLRWLNTKRSTHFSAVDAFTVSLERLGLSGESGDITDWLLLNTSDYFEKVIRENGSLIFSVKAESWGRTQFFRAVFHAAMNIPDTFLIIYGFPDWKPDDTEGLREHRAMVGNGPSIKGTSVLVKCRPESVTQIATKFLAKHTIMTENYRLLGDGDALISDRHEISFASWNSEQDKQLR